MMNHCAPGRIVVSADKSAIQSSIRAGIHDFYVYVLRGSVDQVPFYVGKGCYHRLFFHEAEARDTTKSSHKTNLIRKLWRTGASVVYEIDGFFETEAEAFERERTLIKQLGRRDCGTGPLCNSTDGGEGLCNPSDDIKHRWRMAWSGTEGDTERSRLNRYFMGIFQTDAVPLKPLSDYKPDVLKSRSRGIGFTRRQAATLLASMHCNGLLASAGCEVPRRLIVDDVPSVIENGAGNDLLTSGMCSLRQPTVGKSETFIVSAAAIGYLLETFDQGLLEALGVVPPCE